ncbi:TniQ family protein [Streptomyces sp. NPDC058128]|uniref:TniQ family protein n=1 Tax=Streptomyces sp. NPDC058128 TaxID=3346352 RepID=UPI0036E9093A
MREHVRALPLRPRFLAGESTGSYVTRLASRNGLTVGQLLDSVGKGLSAAEVDPRYTELYVNRAARERLAALVGRPVEELVRALPSLGEEHLLSDGKSGQPLWRWPWEPRGGYLVRGCALCAAARDAGDSVWLISPDTWQICVHHGRLMDNSRDDRELFIDLSRGPHVLEAERRRVELVRTLGPAGRALVADAFGVLAHEFSKAPRLGTSRTTPLVLLPSVMRIASVMVSAERRRLAGRLSSAESEQWLQQAASGLGHGSGWGLRAWRAQHPPLGTPVPRSQRGTYLPLAAPHEQVSGMQSVDELSCVPWKVLADVERPYG